MPFNGQSILPAIKKMKDFERVLESSWEHLILLDVPLGQLGAVMKEANRHHKKVLLHADLIQGLKTDAASAAYLCQVIRPHAIISTRSDMLITAKKHRVLAIQRIFLIDTLALETSYKLVDKVQPDFVEVLPGIVPDYIREVHDQTGVPVIAGGLIRTEAEQRAALAAGAVAVTTSRPALWAR